MKTCHKCNESKPTTEFHKRAEMHDGLQTCCKVCTKSIDAERYLVNTKKILAKNEAWATANPIKIKAISIAWGRKHPEVKAKYYADNLDKCKQANANWWEDNPDARRIYSHNYRARKLENGGNLSIGLAEKLLELQKGKCACGCKQPLGDKYHLDHIMPIKLGGANTDDNIQLLRQKCNNQKHAKHPIEFMQQRGFLL